MSAGKGSRRRPPVVSEAELERRWMLAFNSGRTDYGPFQRWMQRLARQVSDEILQREK